MQGIEFEGAQELTFRATNEVNQIFQEALRSGQTLTLDNLLLFMRKGESIGAEVVESLAQEHPKFETLPSISGRGEVPAGLLTLQNQKLPISLQVDGLLKEAQRIAGVGNRIDTGHLMEAEINRPDSVFVSLLEPTKLYGKDPRQVLHILVDLVRKDYQAESANGIELRLESTARTKDLVSMVKEGAFSGVVVKKEWQSDVLASLYRHTVVTIMSPQLEEGDAIAVSLAKTLSQDEKGVLGFKKVTIIDPEALAYDSREAVNEAINRSQEGIVYLPDPEWLHLDVVLQAIRARKVKILTLSNDEQWREEVKQSRILGNAQKVYLAAPTHKEAVDLLKANRPGLERELGFPIADDAFEEAAKLSERYMRDIFTLEGARQLFYQAAAELKEAHSGVPALQDEGVTAEALISKNLIQFALGRLRGIKIQELSKARLRNMEGELGEEIVGQDEAIGAVSKAIRRARAGLKKPNKPIGSFMFLGPSGVGKTELTRTLAKFMFNDPDATITVDMQEYQEKHTVSRLFGAPPGYVGYEAGGQLTEAVLRNPYSIVVFDEIEKAHPEVWQTLLGIMDKGEMTDSHGRKVDFRNCVLIMTGNVGSAFYKNEAKEGRENVVKRVKDKVEKTFTPEFRNRIDEIIIFNSLKMEQIIKIMDIQLRKMSGLLAEQHITLELTKAAKEFVAKAGYDPELGVRPLERAIQALVSDPLSDKILAEEVREGSQVKVDLGEKGLTFTL